MRRAVVSSFAVALAASACVHDAVLPDEQIAPVCGNGIVEPGEACDVDSPGCVGCVVVPTWTCNGGCTPVCGDGVACPNARRDDACSMQGFWAARESTYLREPILGSIQVSSQWYLYELAQDGDAFHVVSSLDCGILVTGSATVRYSPDALRAMLHANRQEGSRGRPARRGLARAVPAGCEIAWDRWYNVRGITDDYLPADFLARPELDTLKELPIVRDPVANERPEGTTDPDADGSPGLAFQIAGLAGGTRNSIQRDFKEYATPPGASVPAASLSFVIPGHHDLQENVMRVTECGSACSLIATVARVAKDVPPRLALAFVGRTATGERTRLVAPRPIASSVDADLAICANVRLLLPHDGSHP